MVSPENVAVTVSVPATSELVVHVAIWFDGSRIGPPHKTVVPFNVKVTVSVDAVETGENVAVDDSWAVKVTDVSTVADDGEAVKANVAGAGFTVWATVVTGDVEKLGSPELKVAPMLLDPAISAFVVQVAV